MAETFNVSSDPAPGPIDGPRDVPSSLPDLDSPPRTVPWVIQWHLISQRVRMVIGVGVAFVLASLVFIVPQFAAGARWESPFQLIPFVHLTVGLGMMLVPLIQWRRKVAVLKWGRLAAARLLALQDQGTRRSPNGESFGVRNIDGPWLDYPAAFARARQFWNRPAISAGSIPVGSIPFPLIILGGFGCFVIACGLCTIVFMIVMVTMMWLSDAPFAAKVNGTLFCLAFLGAYLGICWLMLRAFRKMKRFASGELPMSQVGVPTIVHGRLAFLDESGRERVVTAAIDLRHRLQTGESNPSDWVVYLPDEPDRIVLLGGVWPPIEIQAGQLLPMRTYRREEHLTRRSP